MTQLQNLIIFYQVKFKSFESDISLGDFDTAQYIMYQFILIHSSSLLYEYIACLLSG